MTKEHLAPWVEEISEPSDQDPSVRTTAYSDEDRDAILKKFRRFCEQLDFRLETFTSHDPSMLEVFESDVNLRAEMVGQHVHTFLGR